MKFEPNDAMLTDANSAPVSEAEAFPWVDPDSLVKDTGRPDKTVAQRLQAEEDPTWGDLDAALQEISHLPKNANAPVSLTEEDSEWASAEEIMKDLSTQPDASSIPAADSNWDDHEDFLKNPKLPMGVSPEMIRNWNALDAALEDLIYQSNGEDAAVVAEDEDALWEGPEAFLKDADTSAKDPDAPDITIVHLLLKLIHNYLKREDGFASVSAAKALLHQIRPDFDCRKYGYAKLRQLLNAYPLMYQVVYEYGADGSAVAVFRCLL